MAQSYTRQSTFVDGDTITAALFNNEYNQLLNAFSYSSTSASSTGHRHDGTAGHGGNIHTIGDLDFLNKIVADSTNNRWGFFVQVSSSAVEQIRLSDGVLAPVTDSDVDLGTSSLYWKDAYIDSITTTGNVAVGGNLTVTGNATIAGNLTFGDAATDTVAFSADVASNLLPSADNTYDIGASGSEWKDLYIDGTANIDSLVADTADINGGTVDGAIIGGSSAAAITGTAITGTSFVIGSADINEAELETIDGVTAGTVAASKAVVVDSNKDIGSFRNITLTGELDAGSLDVSGDADIDGTLETDALSINGTTVTSTAAELNILDGVTSTAAELNILDGVTSTAAELNILDGVTATAAEINALDGITSTVSELNILDGVTASATDINLIDGITAGTVIASKAIITDSNKDITGGRNITISGELDAATLDISGDADIDGTLEADAITIGGVTLAETISDTVGAMVGSNTETNITVTYEDSDNTLDFVIGTLNQDTTGNASTFTATANNSTDETVYPIFVDGATGSQGAETDTGLTYNPSTGMLTTTGVTATFTGNITGNVTGNTSGTAATVTGAAQSNITSLGTLTTLTVDNVIVNGTTIGHTSDTDLITLADGNVTIAGELDLTTLDVSGNADIDGTLEADAYTVNGTNLDEYIEDTVGAMLSSNTETGIAVTYQDGDSTIDFALDAAQTGITSLLATDIKIGEDDQTKIDFETADEIHFFAANAEQVYVADGIFGPQTDSDVDLGSTSVRWKDAYIDSVTTTGNASVGGNLTLTGNLVVNGTTTTVNSTTVTIDDPIFTLGGDSAPGSDDNKDRGIEFRWHNGSAAKLGFFGYDDSASAFTFVPDASNSSEVFSGTVGNAIFGDITGTLQTAAQANITSLGTLTALTGGTGDFNWDSNTLVVDSSANRVGIGNASPDVSLDIGSFTDAIHVPSGTTAQRPGSPAAGYLRYNSTTGDFEGYTDAWGAIAGAGGTAPAVDTMTGDGSDTTLTLTSAPVNENATVVTIDGVVQHKGTYSVSGNTLTFSEAPPDDTAVECITWVNTTVNSALLMQDADGDTQIQVEESSDEDKIRFDTGGTERMIIDSTGVGIGTSSPSANLHIYSTADNKPHLLLENFQNADTDDAPVIELYTNDQTTGGIGDNTDVGVIRFTGDEKDGGTKETYAEIRGVAHDPGSGSGNKGNLSFFVQSAGALAETMTLDENRVGIGTASPDCLVEMTGAHTSSIGMLHLDSTDHAFISLDAAGASNDKGIYFQEAGTSVAIIDHDGSANQLRIHDGSSTHMVVNDNGRVGIGTSSPSTNLDISPSSGAAELKIAGAEGQEASIRLYADEGDDAADIKRFLTDTSGNLKIQHYAGSAFVDSMVINSSGSVGIGTTSPSSLLHCEKALSSDTQSTPETILTLAAKYTSTGVDGAAGSGARLLFKIPDDSTNPQVGASIDGVKENGDDGISSTALVFSTSQNDATLDEAMRIDSSGRFFIGDSTFGGTVARFAVEVPASGAGCLIRVDSAANASETMLQFQDAAGQALGSITSNPSANTTAYNTSSDGRLKDITGEAKGLEIINALNPVAFTWKSSGVKAEGLIAQEVEKLVEHAVSKTKESEYLQMDYSKLVTPLIKAVQELSAEVEQLKQQAHDKCDN